MRAFRLAIPPSTSSNFDLLAGSELPPEEVTVSTLEAEIPFVFANQSPMTFLHPAPLEPSDLVVRHSSLSGAPTGESRVRGMLPLALGPGGTLRVPIRAPVPRRPGSYVVTVSRSAQPDTILASRRIRVTDAAGDRP